MNNAQRAAALKQMGAVLKKNFKVTQPELGRTPIEQLIYSICLENASFSSADDVYNALTHNYFDWNEVRVSSSRELAETMKNLPEPAQTGLRLKRILHYIFDQKYAFEIDEVKRMSVKTFNEYVAKMENVTPFNSAFVMMTVMGRHAIPVSSGEFEVLDILGLIDDKDREKNSVSWLERVIEKKKAWEFFSLLHQLAALYVKNPYGRKIMDILVAIDPKCKDRIPKRRKTEDEAPQQAVENEAQSSDKPQAEVKSDSRTDVKEKSEPKKNAAKAAPVQSEPVQKKQTAKPAEKKAAPEKAADKGSQKKAVLEKKPASDKKSAATEKKAAPEKKPEKKPAEKPVEKKSVKKVSKKSEDKVPATAATTKKATAKSAEKKSNSSTPEKKTVSGKTAAAKSSPVKKTTPTPEAKKSASSKTAKTSATAKKAIGKK